MKFGPRRFRNNPNETLGKCSEEKFAVETGDWCDQVDPRVTLVTSMVHPGVPEQPWDLPSLHWPVIDIDHECAWVPSTNPGHGHLYINKDVSLDGLIEILDVLAKHGIVERGFADATRERGYAAVRLPHVKKIA